jgi:hypothetical protein
MSTAVWTSQLESNSLADTAMKAAPRFWSVVSVVGQFVFAFALAAWVLAGPVKSV